MLRKEHFGAQSRNRKLEDKIQRIAFLLGICYGLISQQLQLCFAAFKRHCKQSSVFSSDNRCFTNSLPLSFRHRNDNNFKKLLLCGPLRRIQDDQKTARLRVKAGSRQTKGFYCQRRAEVERTFRRTGNEGIFSCTAF